MFLLNYHFIFYAISTIFACFFIYSSCFEDPSSSKREEHEGTFFHPESFDSSGSNGKVNRMSKKERIELREEARDMFYHAYNAYMDRAYPADELMPLSCKGRYRGVSPSRGDIDDSLGNFSLTLIDTLDMLALLGDLEEFERAVKLVIDDVTFDNDVVVSVFETNIRVLGGLLSAHVISEYLQQRDGVMKWYKGELLDKAKDVGFRLLPAFNTTTGIPHSRVNLKYGLKHDKLDLLSRETCTACAGSMILEMAALSRLTGEEIFESKAQKAMDELWKMRHRGSDLMGTILNVHSGDWIRRDSGVGAGIDSYYEYCLKAYVLLGDEKYLNRFNRHYQAVMKYISQGPMLLDVHMHRPHTNSRNFMDALLAFWPGLQVLNGDIKPAVETHEMLYQVMQRHKFIPEAFTTDFRVHWGNHPLRPEFLESTYFLYKATGDPYYLEAGKTVLKTLQRYARVPCGYAAVNDVRTGKKEDRMDSFVLAETFKYLYLLFSGEDEDLPVDLDEFLFTTEGHLLPLSLANGSQKIEEGDDEKFDRTCPNAFRLFPETFRKPLENLVEGTCPKFSGSRKRKLSAGEFSPANLDHLRMIKDMGINVLALDDGKVQFLHTYASALTPADAEEGLAFMRDMLEFSRFQSQQPLQPPQAVTMTTRDEDGRRKTVLMPAGPAQFGENLQGDREIKANAVLVEPLRVCEEPKNRENIKGKIAVMERGDCMFVEKVRRVQKMGALAAIVLDTTPGTSAGHSPFFSMSGDGKNDVTIPAVFLFTEESLKLMENLKKSPGLVEISLGELKENERNAEKKTSRDSGNFGKFEKLEKSDDNDEFFRFSQSEKNYQFSRGSQKRKGEEKIEENVEKSRKIEKSEKFEKREEKNGKIDEKKGKLSEFAKNEEKNVEFPNFSQLSQNFEEENIFEKLKISVKQFINKHTGIEFIQKNNKEKSGTQTSPKKIIEFGGFRAILDDYKVKITQNNPVKITQKDNNNPKVNEEWRKIRKNLLKMLLNEENGELLVPLNILRIYYSTLTGEIGRDLTELEEVKQTEWLLNELYEEFSS